MAKFRYHCPGCGDSISLETQVPYSPRSVEAVVRCGRCGFNSFFYATGCPHCGESNFAITSISLRETELRGFCNRCRSGYVWVTP